MKSLPRFPLLIVLLAAASLTPAYAQPAITWGSRGLPPGLSIANSNPSSGTLTIQGTPTQAGNFHAVVYPIVDGVFGDMNEITFRILPAGLELPTFYGYLRRAANVDGEFSALCGGGSYTLGRVGLNGMGFTLNGQDFTVRTPPAGIGMEAYTTGTTVGNQAYAIFRSFSTDQNFMPVTTTRGFRSVNAGTFSEIALPPDLVSNSPSAVGMASDGVARAYLVAVTPGGFGGPASTPPTVRIWRRSLTDAGWSEPASLELSLPPGVSPPNSFGILSVSFAAGLGNLSSVALMTISAEYAPLYQIGGQMPKVTAVIRSSDGGATWSTVVTPQPLESVTFDGRNSRFIGSGSAGVWSSPNGQTRWRLNTWTAVGPITYSAHHRLLFSSLAGVSSDGVSWMPYFTANMPAAPNVGRVLATLDGKTLFWGGGGSLGASLHLSPVFVPTAWPAPLKTGEVNSPFRYDLEVD
jgi:hypothetical protein